MFFACPVATASSFFSLLFVVRHSARSGAERLAERDQGSGRWLRMLKLARPPDRMITTNTINDEYYDDYFTLTTIIYLLHYSIL